MAILEVHDVYHVIPEERAAGRRGGSDVAPISASLLSFPYTSPLWVSEIKRHDFAIFGSVLDENGVTSVDYIVASSAQNQGYLVPSSTFEEDVAAYATIELAKKFATLTSEEIAQFGISRHITDYLNKRYPGMKGFVR